MVEFDGRGIRITRGDEVRFVINISGDAVPNTAQAFLSVKRSPWDKQNTIISEEFAVTDNQVQVVLDEETTDIPAGSYVWILRLRYTVGTDEVLRTPMRWAPFEIEECIEHG